MGISRGGGDGVPGGVGTSWQLYSARKRIRTIQITTFKHVRFEEIRISVASCFIGRSRRGWHL